MVLDVEKEDHCDFPKECERLVDEGGRMVLDSATALKEAEG